MPERDERCKITISNSLGQVGAAWRHLATPKCPILAHSPTGCLLVAYVATSSQERASGARAASPDGPRSMAARSRSRTSSPLTASALSRLAASNDSPTQGSVFEARSMALNCASLPTSSCAMTTSDCARGDGNSASASTTIRAALSRSASHKARATVGVIVVMSSG